MFHVQRSQLGLARYHSLPHIRLSLSSLIAFDRKPSPGYFRPLSLLQTTPIRSDKVLSPPLLYEWQEGVEDLETYYPGGYHPTHIGDRYRDGRYEIVHKLGFGSYSTVWLAKDHQNQSFVALKINVANTTKESIETKVLRTLASGKLHHPGRTHVMAFLDEFTINGPNGCHQCIVSEAVGCSTAHSKDETMPWKFPVDAARAISAQVLMGLDHVHSCGVVHGDLHSNNILFRLPDYGSGRVEDIYRRFGEPLELPVQRLDDQPTGPECPRYCVPPARIFQSCDEITEDVLNYLSSRWNM